MKFYKPTALFLSLFVISFSAVLGQRLKYNSTNKVDHAFYQYYLGHDNDKNFVLASNYDLMGEYQHEQMNYAIQFTAKEKIMVLVYNNNFNEPQQIELEFKHKVDAVISAYFSTDNKIVIIYGVSEHKDAGFYSETFDENGVSQSESTIIEKEEKGLTAPSAGLYCSANHSWFLYKQGNEAQLMDNNYKKVWRKSMDNLDVNFHVLNDGSVLMKTYEKSRDDDPKYISKIDAKGQRKKIALKPHRSEE